MWGGSKHGRVVMMKVGNVGMGMGLSSETGKKERLI